MKTRASLPDEHKTCIYRVVQEALHNCARHAQAHNVTVEVRQEPSKIVLSVEDDGHGFDARARPRPGSGGHGGTRSSSGRRAARALAARYRNDRRGGCCRLPVR